MKRLTFTLLVAFFAMGSQAQGVYLSVNPFGTLEPQAAYGMTVGYIFNEQFDVSTEYSLLRKPTWTEGGRYDNVKGFRSITTLKFTTSGNEWNRTRNFVGAELRVRQFSYTDMQDFTNLNTHAVISDYSYQNSTKSIGVAALIGKQREIGYSGKWFLEFTAGIGIRHTTVSRFNTPENSTIVPVETTMWGEIPNYKNEQTAFYFPLAARIILKL